MISNGVQEKAHGPNVGSLGFNAKDRIEITLRILEQLQLATSACLFKPKGLVVEDSVALAMILLKRE